jgi:hypothetical protein
VPVDFNTQMLGERLQSSGYSEQAKTLFVRRWSNSSRCILPAPMPGV